MTPQFTLPHWYDLHTHFRQDETLPATVKDHVSMQCAGALAMPNTAPPVGKVFEADEVSSYKSIEQYRSEILAASGGVFKEVIVPLYLTQDTTPEMIEKGAAAGVLKACKYYPPHGTTGAEFGAPLDRFMENGVFRALEQAGVTLCIHGEEHGLGPERYFDRAENAEEIFYRDRMPRLVDSFPDLRIVGEHLTTKVGVDFILEAPSHVKANITPQHLMYTVGSLLNGLKYHLYCLPLVKYDEDRAALRAAATATNNTKFFAGTDSAPHTKKTTPCGCAAGCYTGGIAPQLYAQAFEMAGIDLSQKAGQDILENFLCTIGREYYDLPMPEQTFILERSAEDVQPLKIGDQTIIPLPLGMECELPWRIRR
ncbi:MAG: dihydroorotase [Alphaproteobacteria bacterium]|nr:MAG: dihydroorotase [Alphaproteobacteria bacterium]